MFQTTNQMWISNHEYIYIDGIYLHIISLYYISLSLSLHHPFEIEYTSPIDLNP